MNYDGLAIEPWLEESNKIPPQLFKRRVKTMPRHRAEPLFRLNRTEETLMRKVNTEDNGIVFKSLKHNEAKVVTLNLDLKTKSDCSNLDQLDTSSKRQEIAKKKSIQGFSICSLKKKPLCFYDLTPQSASQTLYISTRKSDRKILSTSHFLLESKITKSPKERTNSLNITKMNLKTMPITESKDFFEEIAKLWQEKNKILAKQGR